jgi:vacuolar protein-sorting-associated protein 4
MPAPTLLSLNGKRFSGSDISVVVRDALMQPVRKVQTATHFKQVIAPAKENPGANKEYVTPCSPGDPGAFESNWMNIDGDKLLEPSLVLNDFVRAVSTCRPTVSKDDLERYETWTKEFGQEG